MFGSAGKMAETIYGSQMTKIIRTGCKESKQLEKETRTKSMQKKLASIFLQKKKKRDDKYVMKTKAKKQRNEETKERKKK